MKGFFDKEKEPEPKIKHKTTTKNKSKIYDCETCRLYKNCNSPKMRPTGRGKLKILIIAEAPGQIEDEDGIQLIGSSGQLFRDYINNIGYDLDMHFWKTNSIICRPPKNRAPSKDELKCCRNNLLATIKQYNPKGIILLGAVATEAVIGYRLTGRLNDTSFSDLLGECIPDQEIKTWLCPIYHPSHLLRNDYREDLKLLYDKHIRNAISTILHSDFPQIDLDKIIYTTEKEKAISYIKSFNICKSVAFDYETTGIKPHREVHKIYTASISDGKISYAFPFFKDTDFRKAWEDLMLNNNIKIAHEARFEQQWTKNKCGYYVNKLSWDTSLAQKCLNNQKKTNLKLWVYIYFGIIGYDHEIDKYLRTHIEDGYEDSDHAYNIIEQADINKILKYNALDSLFTYWIFMKQLSMRHHQKEGFDFFMEGMHNLLIATENGIKIDENRLDESIKTAERKISKYLIKLKTYKDFNYNSPVQLINYLYKELGIECPAETKKGNKKVDKITLEKINHPFVKDLLQYRRWIKAKDPYMNQYKRETLNGLINAFYNLNKVTTFRSSSNSVNFQNNPKRDKEIMRMIRSFIIPRKGNKIVEDDTKGMEVCVSACYNKDPNLIKYILNPESDMHKDSAADLFLQDKNKITDQERFIAKNDFVFAEFYGDYYERVAPNLWNDMTVNTKNHLKEQGIKVLNDFIEHVRSVEEVFWNEKFPVYKEWKEKTFYDYEKTGYIDLYTGFRCYAPMKKNEVINYRIQGSAFHILLWIFNYITPFLSELEKSFLIGQIHDSLVLDVYPDDEQYIDNKILEAIKKVREYWSWIIVPLTVEKECSEIDGNWAEMKKQGVLR